MDTLERANFGHPRQVPENLQRCAFPALYPAYLGKNTIPGESGEDGKLHRQ